MCGRKGEGGSTECSVCEVGLKKRVLLTKRLCRSLWCWGTLPAGLPARLPSKPLSQPDSQPLIDGYRKQRCPFVTHSTMRHLPGGDKRGHLGETGK